MRNATFCVLFAISALLVSATAASSAVRGMTPSQAASAVRAQGDALAPPSDLMAVSCRGLARVAPGRFTTFRCTATLEDGRLALTAKVRRAGGLCWGLGIVPSGCLAPGKRSTGSVTEVARAVYAQLGPPAQTFSVMAHGAGFYSWKWSSGGVDRRGSVTFTPAPVVRQL